MFIHKDVGLRYAMQMWFDCDVVFSSSKSLAAI